MVLSEVLQMMQQHTDVEELQEFGCQVLDGIAMYCQGQVQICYSKLRCSTHIRVMTDLEEHPTLVRTLAQALKMYEKNWMIRHHMRWAVRQIAVQSKSETAVHSELLI